MARITVEDCLKNIPNRFEMTLAAAARAGLQATIYAFLARVLGDPADAA